MSRVIPREVSSELDQYDQRLLWTGAIANGALLLGLIGFAGNADDGLRAIRDLTAPLALALIGVACGGIAIVYCTLRLEVRPLEAIAHTQIDRAMVDLAAFKEVLTTPVMDEGVARLVWGDGAEDEMRKLIVGRLKAADEADVRSQKGHDEAMAALKGYADDVLTFTVAARRWLSASFVMSALSVIALVACAWWST